MFPKLLDVYRLFLPAFVSTVMFESHHTLHFHRELFATGVTIDPYQTLFYVSFLLI